MFLFWNQYFLFIPGQTSQYPSRDRALIWFNDLGDCREHSTHIQTRIHEDILKIIYRSGNFCSDWFVVVVVGVAMKY